jgi:hypothetical protein
MNRGVYTARIMGMVGIMGVDKEVSVHAVSEHEIRGLYI